MLEPHFAFWPPGAPRHLALPATGVHENLAVTARRYPDKAVLIYYDSIITYAELAQAVERLAGWLVRQAGVRRRDRVLLYLQNAPQFVIGYYAILRAGAVVVPVTPMNRGPELAHIAGDSGARVAIVGSELLEEARPLQARGLLSQILVVHYGDYLSRPTDLPLPEVLRRPAPERLPEGCTAWGEALAADLFAPPATIGPDDWCLLAYSSGTTGRPKGCLHSHRTVSAPLMGSVLWNVTHTSAVALATLPLFHVTGMQNSMNGLIFVGATSVLMTRWDRRVAATLIARYRVTHWRSITTMAVDFAGDPEIARADLSSLVTIGGGGAQMPRAVAERLRKLTGLDYVEGYGLTETAAGAIINPPQRTKPQCLGIPIFDVAAMIVDPDSLESLADGSVGEILLSGPQVFLGYWNDPAATAAAFVEREGRRFFRTGDLGYRDEEGYYFLVDRLKRMINASGFKVWPAEVEATLYEHPEIVEACVVASPDAHRGETVKAYVVCCPGSRLTAEALQEWCRARMAAYKVPRRIAFTEDLPKSGSGKILWRSLQEAEWAAAAEPSDGAAVDA